MLDFLTQTWTQIVLRKENKMNKKLMLALAVALTMTATTYAGPHHGGPRGFGRTAHMHHRASPRHMPHYGHRHHGSV